MPFGFSSKKASALATKPEAMSSEVTLVDSLHVRSDKQATAGNDPGPTFIMHNGQYG